MYIQVVQLKLEFYTTNNKKQNGKKPHYKETDTVTEISNVKKY